MAKKFMYITYYYPPRGGIGTIRVLKFQAQLIRMEASWQSLILTPDDSAPSGMKWDAEFSYDDVYEVIRTRYIDIVPRKGTGSLSKRTKPSSGRFTLSRLAHELIVPDTRIGWVFPGREAALRRLLTKDIDLIYSTSPPETSHLIARDIAKYTGLPWIAEIRDPWGLKYDDIKKTSPRQAIDRQLEKWALRYATSLVVPTSGMKRAYQKIYPKKSITLIRNSFDPEHFAIIGDSPSLDTFTLLHAGTIYSQELLEMFLEGLEIFLGANPSFKRKLFLAFCGPKNAYLEKIYAYKDYVLSPPDPVSYHDTLRGLKRANLIVVFNASDIAVPAKLYEAIGSGNPVLLITKNQQSEAANITGNIRSGFVATSPEEVRAALGCVYGFWKDSMIIPPTENQIRPYSLETQTTALVKLFDNTSPRYHVGVDLAKGKDYSAIHYVQIPKELL